MASTTVSDRQAELDRMLEESRKLPGVAEIIAVHGAAAHSMGVVAQMHTFISRSATGGNC